MGGEEEDDVRYRDGCPLPQALDPFYWDTGNIQSNQTHSGLTTAGFSGQKLKHCKKDRLCNSKNLLFVDNGVNLLEADK